MFTRQTETFKKWLAGLRDAKAVRTIRIRIVRLESGLFGDVKALGGGLSELRIDFGPGNRLYFTKHNGIVIWLISGGDKSSQSRDIEKARQIMFDLNSSMTED